MYSPALVLLTVAATAYSRSAYKFAAGVEAYLSKPIIKNFDCAGKAYGYYADQDHGCEIFHVCQPIENDVGQVIKTAHYSFACGNQTVFSQDSLTCNIPENAFPCDEAHTLFNATVSPLFPRIDGSFVLVSSPVFECGGRPCINDEDINFFE